MVLLAGLALMVSGGCKTKRVYEERTSTWIQQATGEVDLGFGMVYPTADEQQEQELGETRAREGDARSQRDRRQEQPAATGAPRVEFGRPEVTVEVEGVDY